MKELAESRGRNWMLVMWVMFFGLVIGTGSSKYYIHAGLLWLLVTGFAILSIVLFVTTLFGTSETHGDNCCEDNACGHSHNTGKPRRIYFHVIPLLLFGLAMNSGQRSLGSDAARMKGLSWNRGAVAGRTFSGEREGLDESGYRRTDVYRMQADNRWVFGGKAAFDAMIYITSDRDRVPKGVKTEEFKVLAMRYVMVCCAADAQPIVVLLDGVTQQQFSADTWVHVRGVLSRDKGIPRVKVEDIHQIEEPRQPYLAP